jgi:phage shock protein A
MVFADGRMVERVDQLESEVAQLQDIVAELKARLDALEANPAVEVLRDAVVDVVDVPDSGHPERQSPHWAAP